MNKIIFVLILAVVLAAAGCSKSSEESPNAAANNVVSPEVQPDGTTMMIAEGQNGLKSEVKTFPTGIIIQVTRVSKPDGTRTATVRLRNGYSTDLQDRADIDRAIEMTSDELVAAVKKVPGAAEYATAAPTPTSNAAPESKPEVKKDEKPAPTKVLNEGSPSSPTDKSKPKPSPKKP